MALCDVILCSTPLTESSVCGIVSSCPEIGSTASAASAATAAATLSAAPVTCATAATASATDKTLLGLFSVILRPDQLILQLLLLLLLSATASAKCYCFCCFCYYQGIVSSYPETGANNQSTAHQRINSHGTTK